MQQFEYVIKDAVGIHARPAGQLVKEAKKYASRITVSVDGRSADATRLMALMGLGVKCGNTVLVVCEGEDEQAACDGMQAFFRENL